MQHSDSPFCHIKEVVNAKKYHRCHVHLKYIHFHLETTSRELHLSLGNLMIIRVTGIERTWLGLVWPHA